MDSVFKYRCDGVVKEVKLSQEEITAILSGRTSMLLHYDKIENILNDTDITDLDFARIFKAYFKMRMYGEIPDFSDDRFLRKSFEVLISGDTHTDKKYIERVLTNRANGYKGGRPQSNNDGGQEEQPENTEADYP